MCRFFSRGALSVLPFFFWGSLSGAVPSAPADLYRVFYLPLSETVAWLSKDRGDRHKDIFLVRHHLPLRGRSMTVIPVAPYTGHAVPERRYLPVHLDMPARRTVTFFLNGADAGSLSVNGEKKGVFDLRGSGGYVEARISFAPGVYTVLFTVEKARPGIPIGLLADQPVTLSARGFTKDFSASVAVLTRSVPDAAVYERLWRTRCIPAPRDDDASGAAWASSFAPSGGTPSFDEKTALIVLLRNAAEAKARAVLRKAGFSENDIDWWIMWFSEGEVCRDVRSS